MLRVPTSFVFVPTAELRAAVGDRWLRPLAAAAHREVALAARGFDIHHLQFSFRRRVVAVCSRVRRDGTVEIEAGLGDPALPFSAFTAVQAREAHEAALRRQRERERAARWR